LLRIGHKGADAILPGNTLESFRAAVELGVDAIELDVLRPELDFADGSNWRRAAAGPGAATGPLVIAHDWADAGRRDPLTLAEALEALAAPPLDGVRFNLDLKLAGREDELVAALRDRDLVGRAMVSTMEVASVRYLGAVAPELARGWTLPRVYRDWARSRWLRPVYLAGSASLRVRLPAIVSRHAPALGVWAVWVHHGLISARLITAARAVGVAVIAWTVDDPARVAALAALGVDGICSNDPGLLVAVGSA
jgi:glycerophosphoryl diester phosphodiesterase